MPIFLSFEAIEPGAMGIDALTIPSTYARLIIELCQRRGVDISAAAAALDPRQLDDPDGRLRLVEVGALLYQAFVRDPAIGYEIGLNTQLTSHGYVGYGVLTNPSFRQALDFGVRYGPLRTPFVSLKDRSTGDLGIIEIQESFALGPAKQVCMEHFLIGIWRIAQMLARTSGLDEVAFSLHFQHAEPACHARYRDRLPPCHFLSPANQLRFPGGYMDMPLATADEAAAQLAVRECERERARSGDTASSITLRTLAVMEHCVAPPPLEEAARRLHMSARTLKRRLREERSSYRELLDRHRQQLATQRLQDDRLSIGEIAAELGYTAPENFTRAFRKWTGLSPSAMRRQLRGQ